MNILWKDLRSYVGYPRTVLTTSSILRIETTVSEARLTAEVETRRGCITFSSKIFVMVPLRTLIPLETSPLKMRKLNCENLCSILINFSFIFFKLNYTYFVAYPVHGGFEVR